MSGLPDLLAQIRRERAAACTWLPTRQRAEQLDAPAPDDPQDGDLFVPPPAPRQED